MRTELSPQLKSLEEHRHLRLSEVLALVPVSRSSWFAGVAAGRFPQPSSWGPRTRSYKWSEIKRLLDNPEIGLKKADEADAAWPMEQVEK